MKRALWKELRSGAQDNWIWKAKTKVSGTAKDPYFLFSQFQRELELPILLLPILHPAERWIYQEWSIFTLPVKPFYPSQCLRIKPRLHSLAHKALHDLVPLPASYFSSCSLTLYKSSHAELLAVLPKDHVFFCVQGFPYAVPSAMSVTSPKYSQSPLPSFLLILWGLAITSIRKFPLDSPKLD